MPTLVLFPSTFATFFFFCSRSTSRLRAAVQLGSRRRQQLSGERRRRVRSGPQPQLRVRRQRVHWAGRRVPGPAAAAAPADRHLPADRAAGAARCRRPEGDFRRGRERRARAPSAHEEDEQIGPAVRGLQGLVFFLVLRFDKSRLHFPRNETNTRHIIHI